MSVLITNVGRPGSYPSFDHEQLFPEPFLGTPLLGKQNLKYSYRGQLKALTSDI